VTHELAKLIARYRWLQAETGGSGLVARPEGPVPINAALNEVFLQIITFPAEDPRISYRQIEFLLEVLADGNTDRSLRQELRDHVLTHVKRLTDRIAGARASFAAK
jgi:hypothetical protein